jgi:uncharacterized membrane protein
VFEYLPPLNAHNLPYPDTIHPIVVHFVIAMALFAFVCDTIGYFTKNPLFFEVSWWNMAFATVSIFIAVIFGQVEAGLALPYQSSVESTLHLHTILGWSLSGVVAAITGWRYVLRMKDPKTIPMTYLGAGALLSGLVVFQTYLGDKLVWLYGLHTVEVVKAIRDGVL